MNDSFEYVWHVLEISGGQLTFHREGIFLRVGTVANGGFNLKAKNMNEMAEKLRLRRMEP